MADLKKAKISVDIEGFQAEDWPLVEITLNSVLIWNGRLISRQNIEIELVPNVSNILRICHLDKNNDTQIDQHGNILKDRHCILHAIKINNLVFDLDFLANKKIYFHAQDGEQILSNYFGKNGNLDFEFQWPLWKFWGEVQEIADRYPRYGLTKIG